MSCQIDLQTLGSAIAVALVFQLSAFAENLLRNPSFEETDDGGIADWGSSGMGWYEEPRGAGLSPVSADNVIFQGAGQRSARIDGNGKRGVLRQLLTYDPDWGGNFLLSGWMKFHDIPGDYCRIDVEFIGDNWKWLGSAFVSDDSRKKNSVEWGRFQSEFNVPEGTKTLSIVCRTVSTNSGTVWFDNLALEPKAPNKKTDEANTPEVEALIPIDDLEAPDAKWHGWHKGDSAPEIRVAKEDEISPEKTFMRVKFPESKTNDVRRMWDYDGRWTGLSFKIRRVSGSGAITLYYQCEGACFQAVKLNPDKEWQRVSAPNTQVSYAWGAKNESDKTFNPEKVRRIFFAHDNATEFDIAGLGLDVRDELAIRSAYTCHNANLSSAGERNTLKLEILNAYKNPQQIALKIEVRDRSLKVLHEQSIDLALTPRAYKIKELELPPLPVGYYAIKAALVRNGLMLSEKSVGLCILPPPEKDLRSFMGASVFGMSPENMEIGHRLGVQSAEILVLWDCCEPEKGVFKIDQFEKILDIHEQYGFDTTGLVFLNPAKGMPKWAAAAPTEKDQGRYFAKDPNDFGRFMETLVRKYKDRVHRWSFGCEVDLSVDNWPEGFDGYIAMAKAGCEGAKRADPDCIVGGIGVSGNDCPVLPVARKLWDSLKENLDGIFLDAYSNPHYFGRDLPVSGPETSDAIAYRNAADIVGIPSSGKHIAVEEKGWAIDNSLPVDAPLAWDMADVLARSFIVARSVDVLDHYMWYLLIRDSLEGRYSYSLFRFESGRPNPRPAAAAYAFVSQFLAGAESPQRIPVHDDLQIHVFKHGKGARAALWTTLPNPLSIEMPIPLTSRLTDLTGREIGQGGDRVQSLELSRSPIYLWDENVSADKMVSILKKMSFKLPCAKIAVAMQDIRTLQVHLKGLSPDSVSGLVSLVPPKGWIVKQGTQRVEIPRQGEVVLPFSIVQSPSPLPEHPGAFSITLEAEGQSILRKNVALVFHHIPKLKSHPGVDGNLDKYAGLQPISLEEQLYIRPTDAPSNNLWTGIEDLSVKAWTAWDEQYFYFAAKVRDDKFVNENTGSYLWLGDAIQLGFDPLGNALGSDFRGNSGYDNDDCEFGIALTPKEPQAFQWIGSPDGIGHLIPNPRLAIRREGEMTIYEWALPWKSLKIQPKPGMAFKFNFVVLDVDKAGGGPKCWAGLTDGICGGKNPSLFHNFVLTEK